MRSPQHVLCVFVVIYFSPSFYKWAESTLVQKPKNVAVLSGEVATLNCSSTVSKGNIAWSAVNSRDFIYIDGVLASSVSSYITVSDKDDGNCSLHINASLAAAKRYICIERDSLDETSAELIVLENHMKCNPVVSNGSVHVNCSIVSVGDWDPVVKCEQLHEDNRYTEFNGIQSAKYDHTMVTRTWNFNSDNDVYNIFCTMESRTTDGPRKTIAAYCPKCSNRETDKFCGTERDDENSITWSPTFAGIESNRSCRYNGWCSRKCLLNSDGIAVWFQTKFLTYCEKGFKDLLAEYGQTLSIVSIIGCSISILALALTIIAYAVTWKETKSVHAAFLLELCVALIIAQIVFLFAFSKEYSKDGCKTVSVLVHYIFLVAFFVVFSEGVGLVLFVKYTLGRTRTTIMLSVLAWGLPLITVILSLGISKGEGYDNSIICWLSFGNVLLSQWTFVAPVLLVIATNFVIRTFVEVWTYQKGSAFATLYQKKNIRGTLWSISVTCPVLGIGWLFGVISFAFSSVAFLYLFVITISLQGLAIFVFHALFLNKIINQKLSSVCSKYICRCCKPDPSVSTEMTSKSHNENRGV